MECGYARLTVWFADPFWVGVYEREAEGRLEVCRHTFGAEPKDGEVWQWLLSAWRGLDFSPAVEAPRRPSGRENPAARRQARNRPEKPAAGTRASRPSSSSGRRRVERRSGIAKGTRGGGAQVPPPPGEKEEAPGHQPRRFLSSARINRAPAHILFPR
ncbi:MAG: YjdF family protein [Flavonifractor plautii]